MIFPLSFSCFYIRIHSAGTLPKCIRDSIELFAKWIEIVDLGGRGCPKATPRSRRLLLLCIRNKIISWILNLYFWKVMFQFYHFIFFFLILFNFLNLFQFLIPFDFFSFFYLFHFFLQVLPEWFKNHAKHLRTLPVGYPKKKKWIRKWNLQNLFAEIFNVVYSKFSTGISFQDTCGKKRFPQFAFNHK